jgi:amidase
VLVLAEHPLAPCATDMRAAVDGVAELLHRAGATVARKSALLPDLEDVCNACTTLVTTLLGAFEPNGETPLTAHDWVRLVIKRDAVRVQCRALFEQFDAIVCPPFGCAAFAHDAEPDFDRRSLVIDGRATPYGAQGAWSTLATLAGLPATVAPVAQDTDGLPLGVQIIGPCLEDRSTIALARLLAPSPTRGRGLG